MATGEIAVGAASGAEAAPGSETVFPPFDPATFPSQLFWLAITFLLLYWLMAKVAIPRIGSILAARRARIESDLDAAEQAKAESDAAVAGYEKSLAAARANANTIAEAARSEAKTAAAARRSATEADLAKRLSDAEARIADIKSRALAEVGGIAGDATDAIVRSLTGADVSRPDVDAAVKQALSSGGSRAG